MKQIFSCRSGDTYNYYLGIDENKDEIKQLKMIRSMIEVELYYKLDKIVILGDVTQHFTADGRVK